MQKALFSKGLSFDRWLNIWLSAFMIGACSFKFGKSGILIKNTPKIGEVI
jgi:hypothetical protein